MTEPTAIQKIAELTDGVLLPPGLYAGWPKVLSAVTVARKTLENNE